MRQIVAILVLLLGCLQAGPALAQDASGNWYGERSTSERGWVQWLSRRRADGFMDIEFRYFTNCKPSRTERHAGRWSLAGNVLSTHIFMMDGAKTDTKHRYIIESLTDGIMRYRHEPSGTRFRTERVPSNWAWPGCQVMS